MKHCPLCNQDLPIDDFGIDNSRSDRRNIYCKTCMNQKVHECRERLRAMKRALKEKGQPLPIHILPRRKPIVISETKDVDKVRWAISSGCRTREQIQKKTRLSFDAIGDALPELLWDEKSIVCEKVNGERVYSLRPIEEIPARKPDVGPFIEMANKFGPLIRGARVVREVA